MILYFIVFITLNHLVSLAPQSQVSFGGEIESFFLFEGFQEYSLSVERSLDGVEEVWVRETAGINRFEVTFDYIDKTCSFSQVNDSNLSFEESQQEQIDLIIYTTMQLFQQGREHVDWVVLSDDLFLHPIMLQLFDITDLENGQLRCQLNDRTDYEDLRAELNQPGGLMSQKRKEMILHFLNQVSIIGQNNLARNITYSGEDSRIQMSISESLLLQFDQYDKESLRIKEGENFFKEAFVSAVSQIIHSGFAYFSVLIDKKNMPDSLVSYFSESPYLNQLFDMSKRDSGRKMVFRLKMDYSDNWVNDLEKESFETETLKSYIYSISSAISQKRKKGRKRFEDAGLSFSKGIDELRSEINMSKEVKQALYHLETDFFLMAEASPSLAKEVFMQQEKYYFLFQQLMLKIEKKFKHNKVQQKKYLSILMNMGLPFFDCEVLFDLDRAEPAVQLYNILKQITNGDITQMYLFLEGNNACSFLAQSAFWLGLSAENSRINYEGMKKTINLKNEREVAHGKFGIITEKIGEEKGNGELYKYVDLGGKWGADKMKRVWNLLYEKTGMVPKLVDIEQETPIVSKISMEKIDGVPVSKLLAQRQDKNNPFKWTETEDLSYIYEGLEFIRRCVENNIMMIDVHPGNILLTSKGEYKFIDFDRYILLDSVDETQKSSMTTIGIEGLFSLFWESRYTEAEQSAPASKDDFVKTFLERIRSRIQNSQYFSFEEIGQLQKEIQQRQEKIRQQITVIESQTVEDENTNWMSFDQLLQESSLDEKIVTSLVINALQNEVSSRISQFQTGSFYMSIGPEGLKFSISEKKEVQIKGFQYISSLDEKQAFDELLNWMDFLEQMKVKPLHRTLKIANLEGMNELLNNLILIGYLNPFYLDNEGKYQGSKVGKINLNHWTLPQSQIDFFSKVEGFEGRFPYLAELSHSSVTLFEKEILGRSVSYIVYDSSVVPFSQISRQQIETFSSIWFEDYLRLLQVVKDSPIKWNVLQESNLAIDENNHLIILNPYLISEGEEGKESVSSFIVSFLKKINASLGYQIDGFSTASELIDQMKLIAQSQISSLEDDIQLSQAQQDKQMFQVDEKLSEGYGTMSESEELNLSSSSIHLKPENQAEETFLKNEEAYLVQIETQSRRMFLPLLKEELEGYETDDENSDLKNQKIRQKERKAVESHLLLGLNYKEKTPLSDEQKQRFLFSFNSLLPSLVGQFKIPLPFLNLKRIGQSKALISNIYQSELESSQIVIDERVYHVLNELSLDEADKKLLQEMLLENELRQIVLKVNATKNGVILQDQKDKQGISDMDRLEMVSWFQTILSNGEAFEKRRTLFESFLKVVTVKSSQEKVYFDNVFEKLELVVNLVKDSQELRDRVKQFSQIEGMHQAYSYLESLWASNQEKLSPIDLQEILVAGSVLSAA